MRRISEVICELIRADFEMCDKEHFKMDEFAKEKPDFKRITQADFLTRKNNEVRHDSWNEINENLSTTIRENSYDWENMKTNDWKDLKIYGWDYLRRPVVCLENNDG